MPSNCVPLGLPKAFLYPSGDYSEEIRKLEEMPPRQNKASTLFQAGVLVDIIWEASEIINIPKFKFGSCFGDFLKL